jgi:hypothetical protein
MSSTKRILVFKWKYWQFQLFGWSLYLLNEISSAWNAINFNQGFALRFISTFAVLYALLELNRIFYRQIFNRIANPAVYLIIASISSFICSFFWREIRIILDAVFFNPEVKWIEIPRNFEYLSGIITGTWVPFVWSILYFGIKYWQELISERERAQKAIVMAQQAQLQMLRYQLNPHFLFNSLNSVQALIHENPDQADDMIAELSEFLRLTLRYNNRVNISVAEEIEITKKYLLIEKIRYEERLNYTINVDEEALAIEIPCFITQPLVENSIKHGLYANPNGIELKFIVSVTTTELSIEVANTGKLSTGWRIGVGYKNVKERLQNSYPGKFRFFLNESEGLVTAKILISLLDEKTQIHNN